MKITTKFIIMMLIVWLVITSSLLLSAKYILIPWHVDTLTQKVGVTATYIQDTSPFLSEYQLQKHFAKIVDEQKDLSYIVLLAQNGKAIIHSDPSRVGMMFNDEGTLAAARDGKNVEQIYIRDQDNPESIYHGEQIFDLTVPYYDRTGSHVGAISVGLSLKSINQLENRYYQIISITALVFLLFLLLISYRHFKDVISPLSTIAGMARRLGDGNPNHIVNMNREDEIGVLAQEFNNMSQKITTEITNRNYVEQELRASYEELTATNEELTTTNEELVSIEEELRITNEKLNCSYQEIINLLESIKDGFFSIDLNCRVTYMNNEAEKLLSLRKEHVLGKEWWAEMPEELKNQVHSRFQKVMDVQIAVEFNIYIEYLAKWLEFRLYPSHGGLSIYFHDVTARKQQEEELIRKNQYLSSLYEITLELMNRLDLNDLLEVILKRACNLLGTGHGYLYLINEKDSVMTLRMGLGLYEQHLGFSVKYGEGITGKVWQGGEPLFVEDYRSWPYRLQRFENIIDGTLALPIKSDGSVVGVIGLTFLEEGVTIGEHELKLMSSFSQFASIALDNARLYTSIQQEVAERKRAEEKIRHQAHYDHLTNLPNRALFNDRLSRSITQSRRRQEYLGVMFLDLDFFKLVNDTMGHDVGDRLLIFIAQRLSGLLRESDTIARIGGDEFTILLPELVRPEDASKVAEKIRNSFAEPFLLENREFHVTASIGLAVYPIDGEDVNTLLKNADTAMYNAKSQGRNTYRFFDPSMNQKNIKRLELEEALRCALKKEEFVINYQPQIDTFSGRIIGVEALLRWEHPQKGLLAPGEFISVAEETGLIVSIGELVIKNACIQNKLWQESGLPPMHVAVNLSARQFQQNNFVQRTVEILKETQMEPQYLELEITENIAMQDVEFTIKNLKELSQMGISIALDDFGTGYSSLNYLKILPINVLKIDQWFIKDIDHEPNNIDIIDTIILLAHNLKLKVIAEGVETKEQFKYLQSKNCDLLQGYLFYRPMSANDLTALLVEQQNKFNS